LDCLEWQESSPEAKDLLQAMLVVDPVRRCDMAQVLKHPWILGTKLLDGDGASHRLSPLRRAASRAVLMARATHALQKVEGVRQHRMSKADGDEAGEQDRFCGLDAGKSTADAELQHRVKELMWTL